MPRTLPRSLTLPTFPHVGVVFDLTLDFDAPENQPLAMVRRDRIYRRGWKHRGDKVTGTQTHPFKLIAIGYQSDFDSVCEVLRLHGRIPDGRWREPFRDKFRHDGVHSVGIADASWLDPDGHAQFPYLYLDGDSCFTVAEDDFGDDWRWLVEISK